MRAAVLVLFVAAACGDDDDETVETVEVEAPAERPPEPNGEDPLEGLDDVEALANEAPEVATPAGDITVPEGQCSVLSDVPQRVWARPGFADVVALGEAGFAIAGYTTPEEGTGEELFVATVPLTGAPKPLLRESLERPLRTTRVAPPALAKIDDGHIALAITDLGARVRYTTLQIEGRREDWHDVGSQVDQRFAPAIAVTPGYRAIAFVDAGDEAGMRVRVVRLDPTARVLGRHDLTPSGMGAAAPYSVDNHFFFIDPRVGHSVTLSVELDTVGAPKGNASIVRPISHLYDPCSLAPVRIGERWVIGYTAVGSAATTAVGLAWAEERQTPVPQPIVAGSGYGRLHVDGVRAGRRAVFVADSPKARERDAPRELHVRLATQSDSAVTLSAPLELRGPDGTAHNGRVERHATGVIAAVYSTDEGVYVQTLRCDES